MSARVDMLCLSPHLDDAALSCGGTLAQGADAGRRVLVVTVFAGLPELDTLSPVAQTLHRAWGAGSAQEVVTSRRAEDIDAMRVLGVESVWLDEVDCIYRPRSGGRWRIESEREVFAGGEPEDVALVTSIVARLSALEGVDDETEWLVPLAVGRHVDHELVRVAAERRRPRKIRYYEDFPYAVHPGQLAAALGDPLGWFAEVETLDAPAMQRRLDACLAYRSQVPFLFGGARGLEASIRAYALECGFAQRSLAERRWVAEDAASKRLILGADTGPGVSGHGLRGAG